MFFFGIISAAYIGFHKLYQMAVGLPYTLVTDSPYFYLALTLSLIGVQLFLAGFIGELVVRNSSGRNDYQIEKEI
jgi:Na+/pantothenate symporter